MAKVEVTGEIMKAAIAQSILTAIPEAAGRVYKESQYQNINDDAFYIIERRVTQYKQINKLVRREYDMIVRYEPNTAVQNPLEKCAAMGNILLFALKDIRDSGGIIIHGLNLSLEIVDNNALIYVTYPIRIYVETAEFNAMQDITIIQEVKE